MMKRRHGVFARLALGAVIVVVALAAGCTTGRAAIYSEGLYVSVSPPPPPVAVRVVPSYPRPGHVWVDGYYAWVGNQWVWRPGRWVPARPGLVFVQPTYDPRYRRYYPGYWRDYRAERSHRRREEQRREHHHRHER